MTETWPRIRTQETEKIGIGWKGIRLFRKSIQTEINSSILRLVKMMTDLDNAS